MSNMIGRSIVAAAVFSLNIICLTPAYSQEELEYKKFKLDNASCDVGVKYKKAPQGLVLGVSAVATGKGSEFRKWGVSGIKLRIGSDRIKPDEDGKFYVTEESFFRVPGAVLFAVIGALGEYGGSNFNNTMSKIGVALGLGLIALQAKGEIAGERCIFNIPPDVAERIEEGKDNIEILIANDNLHVEHTIKIGIIRPAGDTESKYDFKGMTEDDILGRMDLLKSRIASLEQERSGYKYGEDPQFDVIGRKVETLETERALAYKAWFEKKNGRDGIQQ